MDDKGRIWWHCQVPPELIEATLKQSYCTVTETVIV